MPNPPPGPPHRAQPWAGTNLSLPPWQFSPGVSQALRAWAARGSQGSCLSCTSLCLAKGPARLALGTAPLPAELRCAGTAPSTPRLTGHAAATPARGEKTPGQRRLRLRLPASVPSPPGLGGIKKHQRELFPARFKIARQRAGPRRLGFVQRAAKARIRLQCWARGGFTPCPGTEGNAGREGTAGRERSTGRGRAAREGELLAGASACWRRAADLSCEAPAKFKVMQWRVAQHERRPPGRSALT